MTKQYLSKETPCSLCGETSGLIYHHKDNSRCLGKNYVNDDPSNLLLICFDCHSKEHKKMEKKDKLFNLFLTDQLRDWLRIKAKESGMSASAFIRSILITMAINDGGIKSTIGKAKPILLRKKAKRKYLK
jgi:hypothetical protein